MVIRETRGHNTSAITTTDHDIIIDLKTYGTPIGIEVVRVMVQQTSGSAASFIVSIGTRANFTTGSIHQKYLSSSTLAAVTLDDTVSKYMLSADDGKIYLRILPNTGSDNFYSYSIMFKR